MANEKKRKRSIGVFLESQTENENFSGLKYIKRDHKGQIPSDDLKVFIVPHTHADLCWPEIPDYCIDTCLACIDDLIKFQEVSPGFRFSMEHAFYLKEYLMRHPEATETIVALIKKGYFECGAFYFGPTELTAGGESLIRELYFGKRWLKESFGIDAQVVWNVDCPGHTLQLPQILRRAGVPNFVIWKEFNLFEHDYSGYLGPSLFNWQSPDGSDVITCFTPGGYGVGRMLGFRESYDVLKSRLPEFLDDVASHLEKYDLPRDIFIADGTDVERPTLEVVRNIAEWNHEFLYPNLQLATATEFFNAVDSAALPTSTGEGPNWWDTIGAFQGERVMIERQCEPRQAAAEAFSAIADLISNQFDYPKSLFDQIWEDRLYASEHNSGGRNGLVSDMIKLGKIKSARILSDLTLNQSLAEISLAIDFQGKGKPIVLFNSLMWPRTDVAEVQLEFSKGEQFRLRIVDESGEDVRFQIVQISHFADGSIKQCRILLSVDMPACGYRTFYCLDETPEIEQEPVLVHQGGADYESPWHKISFDPSGYISNLAEKGSDANQLDAANFPLGELLLLENLAHDEDEHLTGKFWRSSAYPSKAWLAENGPVRAEWVIDGEIKGNPYRQSYRFYRTLRRLDISTEIDWKGEADLELRQAFPFAIEGKTNIDYGVPFGHTRFGEENKDWTKIHPSVRGVRNWLRVGTPKKGVTLASEVIPFDFRNRIPQFPNGLLIQPILMKTTFSCHDQLEYLAHLQLDSIENPSDIPDKFDLRPENPEVRWHQTGHHRYDFSLSFDSSEVNAAVSARSGFEHLTPIFSFVHDDHLDMFPHLIKEKIGKRLGNKVRTLPESLSFLSLNKENVIPTWLKKAEDGQGLILRCYEANGKPAEMTIETFRKIEDAWETDIIEYDQQQAKPDANRLEKSIGAYQIETLRLALEREKSK